MPDLDFFGNEKSKYNKFKKEHVCPNRKSDDHSENAITVTYSFSNGIGRASTAKCERCDTTEEITDYSVW